jgi:dienelactone hydrolase
VSSGLGVARIDLPLHGRRASPKLSARLIQGYERLTRGSALDAETSALVEEFARQSTSDLIRTIEALGRRPEIDAERIALAGLGIGAMTSLWAARHSPTLRACVLAGGAGQLSGSPLDPAAMFEDGSASMPDRWLFFSRREDPETSEAAAKALFEALPGSKQQLEMTSAPSQGGITSEAALSARDFLVQTLARR